MKRVVTIGGHGAMIKLSFCLHRLPHLSREAVQTYWFENHAPLVAKHSAALRIRRYVQMHAASDAANAGIGATRTAPAPYDGVAELWWESWDDIVSNTSPDAQTAAATLLKDERKFIHLPHSPLFFGEEKAIFG